MLRRKARYHKVVAWISVTDSSKSSFDRAGWTWSATRWMRSPPRCGWTVEPHTQNTTATQTNRHILNTLQSPIKILLCVASILQNRGRTLFPKMHLGKEPSTREVETFRRARRRETLPGRGKLDGFCGMLFNTIHTPLSSRCVLCILSSQLTIIFERER